MKTFIALLAVLALAAVSMSVKGQSTDEVWVSNQSDQTIMASTVYLFVGNSQFQNRKITSGTAQDDVYTADGCNAAAVVLHQNPLGVILWIDGSVNSQVVWLECDDSIVAESNPNYSDQVDIYLSAYGYINTPVGPVLTTLQP